MAKMSDHPSQKRAVILVVGDSGSGKSTLFAQGANAGYTTNVADFDNKIGAVRRHLTPEGLTRFNYMTLKDNLGATATAAKTFKTVLYQGWKDSTQDLGKVSAWGPDTILGIDSGTFLGEALKREALALDGKKAHEQLQTSHWGEATRQMYNLLDYITSDYVSCNVVITALPLAVDDDTGVSRFYQNFVTKNFSLTSGKFFNNIVRAFTKKDQTYWLRTVSDNRWGLKIDAKMDAEIPADLPKLIKAVTA